MIDRKMYLYAFYESKFPKWGCPRCSNGILQPIENTFYSWEKADVIERGESFINRERIHVDEDLIKSVVFDVYRYSVTLRCENCDEKVSSCGFGNVIEEYISEINDTSFLKMFAPLYFHPTIDIFVIHEKCPEKVVKQIKSSFKLFFADAPAAANYARKAVEEILTNKKVKRFVTAKSNRRVPISLHNRIVEFEKSNPEVARKLFAIKWLGNEGSHTNNITWDDVLDAYEILELVIDELYGGYRKSIEKKISKINKTKRPLRLATS